MVNTFLFFKMDNCLFCKIGKGEIPSYNIMEDEGHFAFLDIFPNTPGMTLVVPKQHFDSDAFQMPKDDYSKLLDYSRSVVDLLKKKLGVSRVAMVLEGMGVNHVHVKLYPLHGVGSDFKVFEHSERVFFPKYDGYITTKMGPPGQDLKAIQELIKRE